MRELHMVSFDIPHPASYGGIIDVYYQIKSLAENKVPIILHCFQYSGKKRQPHLEELCQEVHYYKRKTGLTGISPNLPYIVYSRRDTQLLDRLAKANGTILFEGIHCCYYLDHPLLKNKYKVVRCLNIEHEYYQLLSKQSRLPKKLIHTEEAKRLRRFQPILKHAQTLLPICSRDGTYFKETFPDLKQKTITAFHGNERDPIDSKLGTFALFHGSLDVVENEKAALFLIHKVFKNMDYPLMIAGKNPGKVLLEAALRNPNTTLISNPDHAQLENLIVDAQMHLMYSTQASGLKLKLLKALFKGKHVIANDLMLTEKGLEIAVERANTVKEWKEAIEKIQSKPFTPLNQQQRKNVIEGYDDQTTVSKLIETLNLGT